MLIGLLMAAAAVAVTADVNALDGMRFRNVPAYTPILLPVAVLALPLADLALAVLRRTAKGTSPFSADRGHLHHKLVDGGYTQAQAVALLWLWAFLVAWGAVSLNFVDHMIVLPVLAVALAGAGYLTLHPIVERRRADRHDAAAHPDERGTRDRGGRPPTPAPLGEPPRLVGILGWSLTAAGAALAITCAAWLLSVGGEAAGSALLGGGAVLALSALTGATTALVWDRAREAALPVSVGLFVLKIAVFAVLLGSCPAPAGSGRTRRRSPPS